MLIIFSDWFQNAIKLRKSSEIGLLQALGKQLNNHVRRYAAYLIHLGVIFIFMAIVGTTAYKQEKQITLKKGESTTIGKYTLTYDTMSQSKDEVKDILHAHVTVFKDGNKIDELTPERYYYRSAMRETQVTTEVDLKSNLAEDLYISLPNLQNDESATFVIMLNPLQNWMWIGGVLMVLGTIIILVHVARTNKVTTQPRSRQDSRIS